jgi:chemotaxis protein MotB
MRPNAMATGRASRRGGGAAHGEAAHSNSGGDYFASMTDLMLGLVFIFVIVLMVFALELREAEQRVATTEQRMTSAVSSLTESNLARSDLLEALARMLAGKLPVTIDAQDGSLQLGGDILFPSGSADVYPEALPKLALLGEALAKVLPCYSSAASGAAPLSQGVAACGLHHRGRLDAVYIEGHTDVTPIHTARFPSNWDLSAARAATTFSRLIEAYPALGTLKNDAAQALIGVSGYGEHRPVDDSGSAAALQKNRRIELRFVMAAPGASEAQAVAAAVDAARH